MSILAAAQESANPLLQGYEAQPASLASLIQEAGAKNPELLAATHAYRAAAHAPKQAGALPDTQVSLQQTEVGSPLPFAGYTNSEFASTALNVSQDLPYPGKRKLRAEIASHAAGSLQAQFQSAAGGVAEQIKIAYFRLAYLQQTRPLLDQDTRLLDDLERAAEARYRQGQGSQHEVFQAQLQETKLLLETTTHHREELQLEARLKQLLSRPQESLNILAEPLVPQPDPALPVLLQQARERNPDIHARQAMVQQSQSQAQLAAKEFKPDFNLQYQYQNTDRRFRDRYMVTLGINLPNRSRREAELAEARENQERASQELQAEVQRRAAELQDQYLAAQASTEQLKIYKEGLLPQAEAVFQSALAAYQANRGSFETLLSAFLDKVSLEEAYQGELASHESALARLETLAGTALP